MATVDLTGEQTDFKMGVNDDIIWSAGPFSADGVIIPRTGKRLRFLLKEDRRDPDDDAVIDLDSVTNPTLVYGVGDAATGVWAIDTRNLIGTVGAYRWQIRLADIGDDATDRRGVGKGGLQVDYD